MSEAAELPALLRQAADELRRACLERPQSSVLYEAWAAHLEKDARALALLVTVLEPLPEL